MVTERFLPVRLPLLVHACYLGPHTDRRIFISDVGNGRIVSVKLGYHAEEKVALKNVPDQKQR